MNFTFRLCRMGPRSYVHMCKGQATFTPFTLAMFWWDISYCHTEFAFGPLSLKNTILIPQ